MFNTVQTMATVLLVVVGFGMGLWQAWARRDR